MFFYYLEKIEASKDNLRRRHRQLALKNKTRLIQQKQREEEIKLIVKECQQLMERQQKLLNDHHLKLKVQEHIFREILNDHPLS